MPNALEQFPVGHPSDGVAWTGALLPNGQKEVTLRSAIQQPDALGGSDTVTIDFLGSVVPIAGGVDGAPPPQPQPSLMTIILTGPLPDITVPLTIDGGDSSLVTITRDTTQGGFFYFSIARSQGASTDIPVTIENMTIRDAVANVAGFNQGGAIQNSAKLTLTNVNLLNNTAKLGGAIFNDTSGVLTISNCTLDSNKATGPGADGGAIFASGSSRTTVFNSTLSNNEAVGGQGGAISLNASASMILTDTNLIGNWAANGGAVYASVGGANVVPFQMTGGSVFCNSATGIGGALYLSGTNSRIQDVWFDANQATKGGAIYTRTNSLSLIGSTFSGNIATLGPIIAYAGVLQPTDTQPQTIWIILTNCSGITANDLISDTNTN